MGYIWKTNCRLLNTQRLQELFKRGFKNKIWVFRTKSKFIKYF